MYVYLMPFSSRPFFLHLFSSLSMFPLSFVASRGWTMRMMVSLPLEPASCIECIIDSNLNVQKYYVTIMMIKFTPFGFSHNSWLKSEAWTAEHLFIALLGMGIPALLSALLSTGKAATWETKWITEYVGADKLGVLLPQESLHTDYNCDYT